MATCKAVAAVAKTVAGPVGPAGGTVVHVPANEDYWHATGDERCVVGLIRPATSGKIRYAEEVAAR